MDDEALVRDAEDVVIRRATTLVADLGIDLEARNQARVHLWFEERFGTPCRPHPSTEAAIGVRLRGGDLELHASFGLADLLARTVRPNPGLVTRDVYERKAGALARAHRPVLAGLT
jgi:hypothetical protein